jgi:hypothetical protein
MSFVDLLSQDHQMMTVKHHMDQNPYISSLCPKPGAVTNNMTRGDDVAQSSNPAEPKWGRLASRPRFAIFSKSVFNTCQLKSATRVSNVGKAVLPQSLVAPAMVSGWPA